MNPSLISPVAALLALSGGLSAATSINLVPLSDAFVSAANASNNYGAASALGVSAGGLAKGEFQSLLMFGFSSAKTQFDTTYGSGGWMVDSISLQLTAANPNNAIFNTSSSGSISLRWLADDSWTEGSGTPASPGATGVAFSALAGILSSPSESLGSHAYNGATSGVVLIDLPLTTGLVTDIGNGGNTTINLLPGDSTVSGLFNSRNNSTPANRPVLTVTASAVPEPTIWMLSMFPALIMVANRRRTS
ncbi:MAG: DNRLRE domain-containing protein [Akkermansiaceae bacterium]|nr:DNRLRE domain-containing protein [Akkermansiaceae bacterium]